MCNLLYCITVMNETTSKQTTSNPYFQEVLSLMTIPSFNSKLLPDTLLILFISHLLGKKKKVIFDGTTSSQIIINPQLVIESPLLTGKEKGYSILGSQLSLKTMLCVYINHCLSPTPGTSHSPISSSFSMSRIICFGSFIFSTAARTIIRCFLF